MKRLFAVAILLSLLLAGTSCGKSEPGSTPTSDTTPPSITNVLASDITETSATITWTTDEKSTSQVEYGETADYGSATPLDESLVTSHSVSLSGLEPDTTYHYRVKSKDTSGNEATSEDKSFTTLALPDTTLPVISEVIASDITETTATITWATDEPATSQVDYGETTDYGLTTTLDEELVTSHSINLSGLEPNTTHHFRVKSKDMNGNESVSSNHTFSTVPDNTSPVSPNGLTARGGYKQVELMWVPNTESDLAGYNIYRAFSTEGPFVRINIS